MITDADIKKMKRVFATKEDMIDFKDSILTEIIKLREDVAVVTGYRGLIEDHDKRIEKIETVIYQ